MRYQGTERRRQVTLRQAFVENPALILLILGSVITAGLSTTGIIVTNRRAADAIERERERSEAGRAVVLYVCEQLEFHRINANMGFVLNAEHHGLDYQPVNGEDNADVAASAIEARQRCHEQFGAGLAKAKAER